VFSTKQRRNLIPADVQPQLWAFLGGIAHKNGFKALMVGGKPKSRAYPTIITRDPAASQSHAIDKRSVVALDE